MNTLAALPSLDELRGANRAAKVTRGWQTALWAHWPTSEQWPLTLDICEAAAYLRVSHATIRNACVSKVLPHQRIGAAYRINRIDLENLGRVEAKTP